MISRGNWGPEFDFEDGEVPSKLDIQIHARSLPRFKLPSNHWYYKQVIPPLEKGGLKQ